MSSLRAHEVLACGWPLLCSIGSNFHFLSDRENLIATLLPYLEPCLGGLRLGHTTRTTYTPSISL